MEEEKQAARKRKLEEMGRYVEGLRAELRELLRAQGQVASEPPAETDEERQRRTERLERFQPFLEALSGWVAGFQAELDTAPDGAWQKMPMPGYEGAPAEHVRSHLAHSMLNCLDITQGIRRIASLEAETAEELEEWLWQLLFRIGPLDGGAMMEVKCMSHEFGPLYHNIMTGFLAYLGPEEYREAVRSRLTWRLGRRRQAGRGFRELRAGLRERLAPRGRLGKAQMRVFTDRLCAVGEAAERYVQMAEGSQQYLAGPVWVGLVEMHLALQDVLHAVHELEPLWALYDRSRGSEYQA